MKKIQILLMIILCLGIVSASSGESFYEQGSQHLSNGDLWNARGAFESATEYLTGEELEEVEEILSFLNRIDSDNSKSILIENDIWYFIGEIKEEDMVSHVYYDIYGDSIIHSMVEGEIDISSYSEDLGISFSTEYIGKRSTLVYESDTYSVLSNTQNQIKMWYCENTDITNILYITYGGNYDETVIFNSELDACPEALSFSMPWWVWLIIVTFVLGGVGYYYGNKYPININLNWLKNLIKKLK